MILLVTYFEIGGKLVELEETLQEATGLGSPRGADSKEAIREVLQTLDLIEPSIERILSSNVEVTWEDIGRLTGGGIGVAVAISTSPLTLMVYYQSLTPHGGLLMQHSQRDPWQQGLV